VTDFTRGVKTMIPLAGPANKQGRIVANNIAGASEEYKGTQGTAIVKVFDLAVAGTGINEKTLKKNGQQNGVDYRTAIIHANSHAGYYPGALPMTVKLVFRNDGKVLGAQIVGYEGVDKRIDVIATAIRFGGTVVDLKGLELAYAPPYSSAKDPVNMVAFTAENILTGKLHTIEAADLDKLDPAGSLILDVREPIERELGYVARSINIPVNSLRERVAELDKNKEIVLYCAVGLRSYIATRILMQNGFTRVRHINGGYTTFKHLYCQDAANRDKCGGVIAGGATAADTRAGGEIKFRDSGDINGRGGKAMGNVISLNACGLQCPGPVMEVYKAMQTMKEGDVVEITASDPGFPNDILSWAGRTGNSVIASGKGEKGTFYARLMKGAPASQPVSRTGSLPNDKTIVVFSSDMDKAMASLIIANGAAAMGRKVTMFYTFWGLNILKRPHPPALKKDFMSAMFGLMLPKGPAHLGLSRMNMLGMGPFMMKKIMKKKNVSTIDMLLKSALSNGVRMIACTMSMDVMGIAKEELIDGIEYSGVASYLGAAEEADVNLFV